MKKFKYLLCTLLLSSNCNIIAQTTPSPSHIQPMERPSVYQQVDEVRNALNLDHNQFEKVYKAYEKYNKAVFGDTDFNGALQGPRPDGRGMGAPGGRPPGTGGGFGGPGGGMGAPGGMPRGQMGGNPPADRNNKNVKKPLSQKEIEKIQKNITKQEAKLETAMQKIFKKNPEKYTEWKKIRERQLFATFPGSPESRRER